MVRDIFDMEKEFEKMRLQVTNIMNSFFNDSFEKNIPLLGENKIVNNTKDNKKLIDVSLKSPATDIVETNNEILAKIEIPGIKKEDIKLEVRDGFLNLRAETKQEKEEKNDKKGYHWVERSYSGFSRIFPIPGKIDENNVKAEYKNGILEVHMPKLKLENQNKPKYIDIK